MNYLIGIRPDGNRRLVSTFGSEQQLLAYVRWATLHEDPNGKRKFEQGSTLVGCVGYEATDVPPAGADEQDVPHNPTPSML